MNSGLSYQKLPLNEDGSLQQDINQEGCLHSDNTRRTIKALRRQRLVLLVLSILSILSTAYSVVRLTLQNTYSQNEPISSYAGLPRDIDEPIFLETGYASANETYATALWESINIDAGVVALDDSYSASRGLPQAQRFPWDQTKGLYLLHGYHNLHCIKIIRLALSEYRTGKIQTRPWPHVAHCADALRRQILCDADDTPRATQRRAERVTGLGQHRHCRDWNALESWAGDHTACYRRPEVVEEGNELKDLFFCPEGSGYMPHRDYQPTDTYLKGLPAENFGSG